MDNKYSTQQSDPQFRFFVFYPRAERERERKKAKPADEHNLVRHDLSNYLMFLSWNFIKPITTKPSRLGKRLFDEWAKVLCGVALLGGRCGTSQTVYSWGESSVAGVRGGARVTGGHRWSFWLHCYTLHWLQRNIEWSEDIAFKCRWKVSLRIASTRAMYKNVLEPSLQTSLSLACFMTLK